MAAPSLFLFSNVNSHLFLRGNAGQHDLCLTAVRKMQIHLDIVSHCPPDCYDKLLWGERQIRSVTNMTRQDARDFLEIANRLQIRPQITTFRLEDANEALLAVKNETGSGSVVLIP